MFRCFDCNNTGDDARALVENGSWTSNSGPGSLQQTVVTEERSMLSTEYKLKFQDFSGRCQSDGPATDVTVPDGPVTGLGRAKTWYSDLLESRRKAITYKVRGWGKESAPSHLVYLYDQAEDPSRPPDKKIISALYLETLQPGISRGRTGSRSRTGASDSVDSRGRAGALSAGSTAGRPHSQTTAAAATAAAAAAAKKSTAKATMKLQISEKRGRPGGAQRVGAKTPGDEVDKAKGRSPSTPRGPPSQPSQPRRKSPGPKPAAPLRVASGPARPRPVSAHGPADSTTITTTDQERGRPVAVKRPTSAAEKPAVAPAAPPTESPAAAREALAALMKSPPEPTRVRSPENSAVLRSPEAVNWTLPLDTARAFTVTQNVGAGQAKAGRPRSSHSTSSGQSQISPLHRQLVTEAMASRTDPPPGWTATHPPKPADAAPPPPAAQDGPTSPTPPPLVRPTDAPSSDHSGQQSFADGPSGAPLFSAGSAAPSQTAVVEMAGAGKAASVRPEGREAPQYHVI